MVVLASGAIHTASPALACEGDKDLGRYYLLPHERLIASFVTKRQSVRPDGPALLRMRESYGPEGVGLISAALANLLPGQLAVIVSIVLIAASRDRGSLSEASRIILVLGVCAVILAVFRIAQAVRRSDTFRGDQS